jgi:hypothetical protein
MIMNLRKKIDVIMWLKKRSTCSGINSNHHQEVF